MLGIFPRNFDFGGLEETWASCILYPTPVMLMHAHIWGGQLQEVFCGLASASCPLSRLSLAWVPPCLRTWAARRCGTSCTTWAISVPREASCFYSHFVIPAQTLFPGRVIYRSAYCHFNCFSFKILTSWWAFPPWNPLNLLSGVFNQECSPPPSPGPASRACDLYSHARPPHSRRSHFWFNALLTLPWNSFCLWTWVSQGMVRQNCIRVSRGDTCNVFVPCSYHLSLTAFVIPMRTEFKWAYHTGRDSEFKARMSCLQLRKWGREAPEVVLSIWNRFHSNTQRRWWQSKNREWPWNPYLSLPTHVTFLWQPATYTEMRTQKKGKTEGGS